MSTPVWWQAVAQGNEFGAALGRQDAGDAGRVEDFALGVGLGRQQVPGVGVQAHPAFGHGGAVGRGLGADVDHADLAVFIQVAEGGGEVCFAHGPMINEDTAGRHAPLL
jgi:hypothetical protein